MGKTDQYDKLEDSIAELLVQIEKGNYKDNLGHELKNNKAYIDIKKLIET